MPNTSEWETPSGRLTDYEGTVMDAAFNLDQYGKLRLELKMATDNPDVPEWTERFGCGADWKSLDGGNTAEHPNRATFLASSGYGKFINSVKELIAGDKGGDPELVGLAMAEVLGDSPRVAGVWVGTKWYFEEKTDNFTDRATNTTTQYSYNVPVKYLGKDDELNGSGSNDRQANANAPQGSVDVLSFLTPDNQAKARSMAATMDYSQWSDEMLGILTAEGLNTNPQWSSIIQAVANPEGLYAGLKG